MKMRKDKDIKRRLQLSKHTGKTYDAHQADENRRSGRVMFAKATSNNGLVFADGPAAKKAGTFSISQRMIALIVAIVMVLVLVPVGVVWHLHGKAEESVALDPVTMSVRINGAKSGTTTIDSGKITDNLSSADVILPDGAEFVKAIVVDKQTEAETQIYAVGSQKDKVYYSVSPSGYTGVEKGTNDELVLIYANKYEVTFSDATFKDGTFTIGAEGFEEGSFKTNTAYDATANKHYIYGGEDLIIKEITPTQDHTTNKVTYKTTNTSGTEKIKNSQSTISGSMITGDMQVTVKFTDVNSYTIQDARYMSGSKYYSEYGGLDNHGGTTLSKSSKGSTNSLGTVDKGQTAKFYVFSQLNSTNSEVWRLSMLSINGNDLNFKNVVDSPITTYTEQFGDITVTYKGELKMDSESKTRSLYYIEVPNVHENVEVNYYYTDITKRKIIVKGLEGIEKTAAAEEHQLGTGLVAGRYYTYASSKQNVYNAYYTAPVLSQNVFPSDNLILYTVKPGYNPYQITTSMKFDNEPSSSAIRETDITGAPQVVIKNAGSDWGDEGRFDTRWRYWGKNTNSLKRQDEKYLGKTLLLTQISKDTANDWYAVAISQNASKDQQLYLNAKPYEYKIKLYTDGGTITDGDYVADSDGYIETKAHKISDDNPFGYLPDDAPVKAGKYFAGWRMLDSNGKEMDTIEHFYASSARIDIDEETIQYAIGNVEDINQVIAFKAIYKDLKDADVTQVAVSSSKQTDVNEDGTPVRTEVLPVTEGTESQVKGSTVVLDDHTGLANNKYYTLSSDSEIGPISTKAQSVEGTTPEDNIFAVNYDYRTVDMSVTNTVLGYPKTQTFTITVTLTREPESPVTIDQAQKLIKATLTGTDTAFAPVIDENAGTMTYTLRLTRDQVVDFTNVPYNWSYTVAEDAKENDYTREISSENGTLTTNTDIEVTNMVDNEELFTSKKIEFDPETNKYKLQLEAWATGESVTTYDKEPVPTDITLVIDQSGSMATKDMNAQPEVAGNSWTIAEATQKQYFYKVTEGGEDHYYPVQALQGTIYEKVETNPYAYQMFGRGHDATVVDGGLSGKYVYNVPTNYYCLGNDNKIHKVYGLTQGVFGEYKVYFYYYTDDTPWKNGVENNNNPIEIKYISLNNSAKLFMKTNSRTTYNKYGSSYIDYNLLGYNGWEDWVSLAYNKKICIVGQKDATISSHDAGSYSYSWFSNGTRVKEDLYLPKDGTTFNRLCYVDSNGNKHEIEGTTVYTENQKANVTLYEYNGTETRTQVLQDAVSNFVNLVQQNAEENDLDHRMSIIGFAGNKTPALSSGTYIGDNGAYDYTNTGIFANGTFYNYDRITGYTALGSSDSAYINRHYYIYKGGKYVPVLYNNGSWYPLGESTAVKRSDYTFYEANYDPLKTDAHNYYSDSLVSVNDSGSVNQYLTSAISQFANYGGTYTSYGMTMANQVLENTYDKDRNHIIVVFTDGEPGGNGFDDAIAGEAKADANIAKNDYGAKVYTVGLFPGDSSASKDAVAFLNELSSETNMTTTDVTPTTIGRNTELSHDPDYTYYYTDEEGKTYAVHAKRQGVSSLGWWNYNGRAYTLLQPRDSSSDERSYVTPFYNASGTEVYSDTVTNNLDATYYTSTTKSETTEIRYEYRWYDTNNSIVEPITTTNPNGYQFFELGAPTHVEDGTDYCLYANNADELLNAFSEIAASMSRTTVKLDAKNSLLRDVVTGNFAEVNKSDVTVETVNGTYDATTGEITWAKTTNPLSDASIDSDYDSENGTTTIDVKGFDYGSQYLSESHPSGQKVRVTIKNVDPLETGFDIESNTNDSGIYRIKDEDNTPSMLVPFELPEVNRPEYSLKVDGDDKNAKYSIKFRLNDGEADLSAAQIAKLTNLNAEDVSFETVNGTDYLVWSNISADANWSVVLEDVFKDLPEGYKVYATATKAGDSDNFTYTVKLNNKVEQNWGEEFELTKSGDEIEITSSRKVVPVTLKEVTQMTDGTSGVADTEKEFTIKLTLKNGNDKVSGTFDGIVFEDGEATLVMKDGQERTINLPDGYTLSIDVDPDTQDPYVDTYTLNGSSVTGNSYEGTIAAGQEITIINSMDEPVVTGFLDNEKSYATIIGIAGCICLATAAGYVYFRRKRRTE